MNKKGQALVEFVIILPVLLCIMLSIIDFGVILYNKNTLESNIDSVVKMIQNKESEDEINHFIKSENKNTEYKLEKKDKYVMIKLISKVDIITPGLNIILNNPYKIEVKRVIYEK